MSAYSDNLPRERYVRDYRDADIHASPLEHPEAIRYERVVRREYVGGSPLGSLFKWLIPALLIGVLVSGLMPSHDIHERGLISSWTDRVSDSISNIGDKIFHRHQPTMMDKARLAAWEAKKAVEDSTYGVADKVTDSVAYLGDKISDTADEALSTVRNKFSGSGRPIKNAKKRVYDLGYEAQDKLYDVKDRAYELSREAQNKLYKAKKHAYKLGRDAQGKLYNAKNRVADSFDDDYYDEYVRQPARRMRRQYNRGDWSDVVPDRVKDFAERNYPRSYRTKTSSSNWSLFHMIRQHPILSTLIGVLLFLSLRPFFNSSSYDNDSNEMGATKRKALSGLALVLDRLGAFLGNMGDQVQNSENFSDMRRRSTQAQNYREYERPVHSDNININRAHVAAASSSSSLSSDIPHNSLSSSLAANHGPSTTTTTVPVVKQTEFTKTKVDQMKSNMDPVQKAEGGQTPVLGGR